MGVISKAIQVLLKKSGRHIGYKIMEIGNHSDFSISVATTLQHKKPASLRKVNSPFQWTDPFLFEYANTLYCFFEEKKLNSPGKIKVRFSSDLEKWSESVCDLGISAHVSYPFVFRDEDNIYMLPETSALNEVALYRSVHFPAKWEKYSVLLKGNFVDSSILAMQDHCYLFTTEKVPFDTATKNSFNYLLRIFCAKKINGHYTEHPASPLHLNRKYGRSGGAVINIGGILYRWSQDCSEEYGNELTLFKIAEITPLRYAEEKIQDCWIRKNFFHKRGGHHISAVNFGGKLIAAVDFNYPDAYFQRFYNFCYKKSLLKI